MNFEVYFRQLGLFETSKIIYDKSQYFIWIDPVEMETRTQSQVADTIKKWCGRP